MTAKQLSIMLSELGDKEVVVQLSQPSIAVSAYSQIESVGIGFDWDEGKVFLIPEKKIIDKKCLKRYNKTKGKKRTSNPFLPLIFKEGIIWKYI